MTHYRNHAEEIAAVRAAVAAGQSDTILTPEQRAAHLEALARSLDCNSGDAPLFDDLGDAMGAIPWALGAIILSLAGLAWWGLS